MSSRMPPPDIHEPHKADDNGDWALLERAGAGDEQAFATLYRRYRGYLERFVYQVTRRSDLVEDVISEVMFAVWQQAGRVETLSRASTWIMGIAHNQALSALRKAKRHIPVHDAVAAAYEPSDDGRAVRGLEAANLLRAAMQQLSAEQRAVLELVYFQGMHYREVGMVLGCPENTVKTRVWSARNKLRDLWPQLAGGDTDLPHQV